MNRRIKKKKNKYIIDDLSILNVKPDDVLILKFNTNKINYMTAHDLMESIQTHFPNKIIMMPNNIDLSKMKEENVIKCLKEYSSKYF